MSVGQELLDVPLPQMVSDLAMGVATAQEALDNNSLQTTLELAKPENAISFVPKIIGTINPDTGESDIVQVEAKNIPLIAFIRPTWYQFSETTIEVSMDIKTSMQKETNVKVGFKAKAGWGPFSASIKTDVEHNRKFGKEVHGTSKLTVKMVPVPPPPLLLPEVDIQVLQPANPTPSGN